MLKKIASVNRKEIPAEILQKFTVINSQQLIYSKISQTKLVDWGVSSNEMMNAHSDSKFSSTTSAEKGPEKE